MSIITFKSLERNECIHGGIFSTNPDIVKLDFSSSINPLGIPKKTLNILSRKLKDLCSTYPDPECRLLKESLVNHLDADIQKEWILCGNGATEIIHIFSKVFSKELCLIPVPSFCEYELSSRIYGSPIEFVKLNDLRLDIDNILESSRKCSTVFLCNPNNPTGILESEAIEKIINRLDSSKIIFLDESFIELTDRPDSYSMVKKLLEYDNLIILRSLTKAYGLAGLRIGYCLANPRIIDLLSHYLVSWNVNGLAQLSALTALSDTEFIKNSREFIRKEREYMINTIWKRCKYAFPLASDVNFFLINLTKITSTNLYQRLLNKQGILVRDCSNFRGMDSNYIRVAVRSRRENSELLKALEMFC